MNILFLNWRDIRSPRAGGAELLTHEIAKRLVDGGARVQLFTSRPDGLPDREDVDGVEIVRRGSELTTRLHAPRATRGTAWDVVVEEINTLPYFAHLWSRARSFLFIPQLAREVWWYEAPLPLAAPGYAAEPLYLSLYRDVETITISKSTLDDLRGLGVRAPIHVIPMATSSPAVPTLAPKDPTGELAIVGRLVPSKRVDHAIRVLGELRRHVPTASLTVVGDGPERGKLESLAAELGIAEHVTFAGRVSEDEKLAILTRATFVVACAVREGWGLTITEAARVGTPSACYRVSGLVDSVVDGRTGVLTEPEPSRLADAIADVLAAPGAYEALRENAWRSWSDLSWDATADAFARAIGVSARAG
jgi:glycosyltransferase involved in cell wall biosynthesis